MMNNVTKELAPKELTIQQKATISWSRLALAGKKHSYAGTVPSTEVATRRRKSKAAKIARRANRG